MALYGLGIKVFFKLNGTNFTIKESDPCGGAIKAKQDKHFPAIGQLDYNNWLVAVNEIPGDIQY